MPILPLIDLLILLGTASLGIGFVIKVITVSTIYSPRLLGFSSFDFLVMAAVVFTFALTLVARSWMKLNEPRLATLRRDTMAAEARLRAAEHDLAVAPINPGNTSNGGTAEFAAAKTASAGHL